MCQFLVQAGNRQFFCCGGKVLLPPEKKVLVVCLAGCAVVSVFGSGGKSEFFLLWRESFITTGEKKVPVVWRLRPEKKKFYVVVRMAGCAVVRLTDRLTDRQRTNTLALRGLEEPAHALRGLEEPFFQLCCCVSFWFRQEIGFGCTYYYVLGVPYSCGVVLVFLVLVGNSFWCYVRT